MTQPKKRKYLILCPSWIGDMVMTHSLIQELKKKYSPSIEIDVCAPQWCLEIARFMPEVRMTIEIAIGHGQLHIIERWKLARMIAKEKYTHAIIIPNSFKSALIPFFAAIPSRIGYFGECRIGLINKVYRKDKRQRFVDQINQLSGSSQLAFPSFPQLTISEDEKDQAIKKFNIKNKQGKILALCPGASFGKSKMWPIHYFADIAQKKINDGWQVWVFGAGSEVELGKEIDSFCKNNVLLKNFIGQCTLSESICLLSLTDHVIANDSGLMHISAALNKSITALYGPTPPSIAPPLTEKAAILYLDIDCSPCFKRECPLKHHHCLKKIKPEMVLKTINNTKAQ